MSDSDIPSTPNQTPAPLRVLTDGEKAVVKQAVTKMLPVVARWICSDHQSKALTAILKSARVLMATAGILDLSGGFFTDTTTADVIDGVCIALPLALELASHFRTEITSWVDRRWPAKVVAP